MVLFERLIELLHVISFFMLIIQIASGTGQRIQRRVARRQSKERLESLRTLSGENPGSAPPFRLPEGRGKARL